MSGSWNKFKKTMSFKGLISRSGSRNNLNEAPSSPATSTDNISTTSSTTSVSSKKTCAICLDHVKSGQGQALFTAECSHSFHFSCIATNVKHGNRICPVCRFKWKEIPFQFSGSSVHFGLPPPNLYQSPPLSPPQRGFVESGDDPLLPLPDTPPGSRVASQTVTINTFTEFPALAAYNSVSRFAVLVGLQAPPLLDVSRAPIDLVTVLDVSGSMAGHKLELLKQAVHFVIDNLGPSDRLSVVSFASTAQKVFPLRTMTQRGRVNAKRAVDFLVSDGGTNIVEGLKKGARILEERREKNPVASIILLSDGQDTHNGILGYQRHTSHYDQFLDLLPDSINTRNREAQDERESMAFPVHTFGFGLDHDSYTMHAISDASGGTFSYIESVEMVRDSFARCIGGLLSVVAQELCLILKSASVGVKIGSIPSGRYSSEISEHGSLGVITVGDLYAEEKKEFIVYLSVPETTTSLLDITCSYKDSVSNEIIRLEDQRVEISRPETLSLTDSIMSMEVDRQMNRLAIANALTESRQLAETGDIQGAQAVLTSTRTTLLSSVSAQAGDNYSTILESELDEASQRMSTRDLYEHTGRAYMFATISSHSGQRATTRGDMRSRTTFLGGNGRSDAGDDSGLYQTRSMFNMVSRSQDLSHIRPNI